MATNTIDVNVIYKNTSDVTKISCQIANSIIHIPAIVDGNAIETLVMLDPNNTIQVEMLV